MNQIEKYYNAEKNESLLKYADMELYEHQKEIFTVCKQKCPKIV